MFMILRGPAGPVYGDSQLIADNVCAMVAAACVGKWPIVK